MNTFKLYLLGTACFLAFFALISYVYSQVRKSQVKDTDIDTTKRGPIALQVYKDGKLVGEYKSISAALRDKTLDISSASIKSSSYMRQKVSDALKNKSMYAGYTWVKIK